MAWKTPYNSTGVNLEPSVSRVPLSDPIFRRISRLADAEGVRAFVVGGYVRDHYLCRPSTDIDVVVVGSGIALAEALGRELHAKVSVFKTFGTAMVRVRGIEVEFVGARRESYSHDSRKPRVEAGTLEDDQRRRDFTINALAWSLNGDSFGELVDPFGGLDDLDACIIRTPCDPDVTFSDDPLRMMRAVRFAAQLGFTIEDETFEAICRNAARIKIVSRERIMTELNKIVLSPVPSMGFELLELTGLLKLIFPEMHRLKGVERRGKHAHKDNFVHTLKVLDNVARRSDDLWLRWAAVLHDIAKPLTKAYDPRAGWTFHGHEVLGSKMVPAIFRQLKLPMNEHMKFVQKLVFLHLRPIILSEDLVTDSAVRRLLFEAGDDIEALMTLCEADITSGIDAKVRRYLANFELVRRKMKDLEERDRIRNFQPPITGEIIMKTYGIGPSRVIGEIKEVIKNAILDGEIPNDYDAAFGLMLRLAAERGLRRPEEGKE
ncbi:MAG: CCA tRNA nucleotidyltransferase [Alistipes sp.]|nr:CCA tRNA nucleotidyltransferase [Alistipes sp.]